MMSPAGRAWALGIGLDLTTHRPRCFRIVLMSSRSSMKLMIRMIPRHPRFREDKLWAGQGIDLPRPSRGQAPIFWISRAQFFRYSFELLSASRMQGPPSSSVSFRFPRHCLRNHPGFIRFFPDHNTIQPGTLLRTLHNSFSPLLIQSLNRPDDDRSRQPQMKIGGRLIPRTRIWCRAPDISSLARLGMK